MKELLTPKNILYSVLGVVLVILAIKGLKYVDGILDENNRLHTDLIGKTEAYQQLSEHAAKLEIQYKSADDIRKQAEKKFKNEMGAMEDKIKILSDATFLIKEKARESNNSDVVFNGPNSSYILNEIRFQDGPPVGYVLIFKDGRVVSKIYNHEIQVNTAVSKSENTGHYVIISKADFVLKSPSLNPGGKVWANVPYPLDITGGTAWVDPTEPVLLQKRFHLWNPKVNANINLDPLGVYPGAGVSLLSYGLTKNDLDYRFLQLGFQVNGQVLEPTITPVLWRPFSGLLSNTYVGPGVTYRSGLVGYFLGVQVGL